MLKLKPFEAYVGTERWSTTSVCAPTRRELATSAKRQISNQSIPFRDDGLVRADIIRILEDSGIGLPPYMEWGRTRSGCYFCFYQQKIEWVRLKEKRIRHCSTRAKEYEEKSVLYGEQFYWSMNESLSELEQPDRIADIKAKWLISEERKRKNRKNVALVHTLGGLQQEGRS